VNAKVREAVVHQISPGLRARIKVDAFPEAELTGAVIAVAPRPDPATLRFRGPDTKVYSTLVEIEKAPPGLRPGMTAEVDILVTELDNVLSVPIEAVLNFDGKDHVAVKKPDGGIEWREVTLGAANETLVEVRKGLESGQSVALNPLALMSEEEKREKKIGAPTEPAARPPIQKQSGKGRGKAARPR
jgi:multidrug efflux pump subunit AcrA (membrane-fusion protein)